MKNKIFVICLAIIAVIAIILAVVRPFDGYPKEVKDKEVINKLVDIVDGNSECYGYGVYSDLFFLSEEKKVIMNEFDDDVTISVLFRDFLTKKKVEFVDVSDDLFDCKDAVFGCHAVKEDIYKEFLNIYGVKEVKNQGISDGMVVFSKGGYGGLCSGEFKAHDQKVNQVSEDTYELTDKVSYNDESNQDKERTVIFTFKKNNNNEYTLYSVE